MCKNVEYVTEYVTCPLCGALVTRAEIEKYGYCKVCQLLIEALASK